MLYEIRLASDILSLDGLLYWETYQFCLLWVGNSKNKENAQLKIFQLE